MELILASSSARRRELLPLLGVSFRAAASGASEKFRPGQKPENVACFLALKKACAVARRYPRCVMLGADTLVVMGKRILGKPRSRKEALDMLNSLRGKRHRVITGLALVRPGKPPLRAYCVTQVVMRNYSSSEMERYVDAGKAWDKAGAYAMQDRAFHPVASFSECACNVIGLPLATTARLLKKAGLKTKPNRSRLRSLCRYCHQHVRKGQS